MMSGKIVGALTAVSLLVVGLGNASSAKADVVNVPIYVNATFDDGTALTGQFQLNTYGYANSAPWSFVTLAGYSENGTPIGAYTFSSTTGSISATGAPNTYAIDFFNGSYSEQLNLTFAHALDIAGPDEIVQGTQAYYPGSPNSGQCAGYSCSPSDERLVVSGVAQVPEPASLALFGAGLAGLAITRRRRFGAPRTA